LKETPILPDQRDAAGVRDMKCSFEAFRESTLASGWARVLAQRKGARLQTLVIDEGFRFAGMCRTPAPNRSHQPREKGFCQVLVITLGMNSKDAFPTRIEVEKTDHGSTVSVI